MTELLEEDSVGETETADPDTLQDTVAAQLVQHERGYDLTSLSKSKEGNIIVQLTCTLHTLLHHSRIYM